MEAASQVKEWHEHRTSLDILICRDREKRVQLDMNDVMISYKEGLGGSFYISQITFHGANLNFYNRPDEEYIYILSSWGWDWNEETKDAVMISVEVMPEDLQRIVVDAAENVIDQMRKG